MLRAAGPPAAARTDRLVNVDVLTYAGNLENLHDLGKLHRGHVFVRADIRDRDAITALLREHRIDTPW